MPKLEPLDPTPTDALDALEVGLSGAMARQYAGDARIFLSGLARLLESALPGEVRVTRVGLLGGASRPIKRIAVDVPGEGEGDATRYVIDNPGHRSLLATRTRIVRGIALKTEPVAVEDWIAAVGAAVAARAKNNKAALDVLKSFLG